MSHIADCGMAASLMSTPGQRPDIPPSLTCSTITPDSTIIDSLGNVMSILTIVPIGGGFGVRRKIAPRDRSRL